MVIFDQLRISDDGSKMYINVHVNNAEYFEHVYLQSLTIVTQDKVTEATDSGEITKDYIYKKTFAANTKNADIVIDKGVLDAAFTGLSTDGSTADTEFTGNFSNNLFFVFVKVTGEPDECTPCSLDKEVTVGVTFDDKLLYQQVMNYTGQLANDCNVPIGFTDFILLWNAFKASVETNHWVPAIKYWEMLMGKKNSSIAGVFNTVRRCGCNG